MAIKKVYDLSVDLKRTRIKANVPVLVQGDSTEFRLRLLENGKELTPEQISGVTSVELLSGYDAQTIIRTVGTMQGSEAVFSIEQGELFKTGQVKAMVRLADADDRISTLNFEYQVISDLTANYIPGEQDVSIFQQYIADAQQKIDEMAATDVQQLSAQLEEKAEQSTIADFNLMAQSPKPPKTGISTTSPKLAMKTGTDAFRVVQKANKGYVVYTLDARAGTTVESHGGNFELVRANKVQHASDAYVAFTGFTNAVGTLVEAVAPSKTPNAVETLLVDYESAKAEDASIFSNKAGNVGLGLYTLVNAAAPATVDFTITTGKARKANVVFYGNANGSEDVDILVNGQVAVKGINTRAFRGTGNLVGIVEFEIPTIITNARQDIVITLRNNSLTDRMFFCGINFKKLSEYNGEQVDTHKVFTNTLKFIDHAGALDYAFREYNGLWMGSYHGGETREYGKLNWKLPTSPTIRNLSDSTLMNFADIPNNDWCIQDELTIEQRTNLLGRAKVLSYWDFNTDGTFTLDIGLHESTIAFETLYTALTTTHPEFAYLTYPTVKEFTGTSGINRFDIIEGKIIQRAGGRNAELTIRFTKFNDIYYKKQAFIQDNNFYKKFYYGAVSIEAGGVVVPNLNFSKSLDFHIQ